MTAWRDAAIRNSLADEISELFQHRFARGRWSYAEMVYWHNLFAKVLPELSPQDPPDVKKEIRNRLLTVYKDDRDKVKKLYENYDSVFRTHFPDFCSQSIIHSDLHPSVVAFRKRQSRG